MSTEAVAHRDVRVFVSSTFGDMESERNLLAKDVFLDLRNRALHRGLGFVDVDLRWGIDETDVARGRVVGACLNEIDRSDYFVCLLGDRYGTTAAHIDDVTHEVHPWLRASERMSLTAIEIAHAVLNREAANPRAFFYFRDTAYRVARAPGRRSSPEPEEDWARVELARLKETIRRRAVNLHEVYRTPEDAAGMIRADLWEAILRDFPEEGGLDSSRKSRREQEAWARSRTVFYLKRAGQFEVLDRHAAGGRTPLIIAAPPGMGKTALIANWILERKRRQADERLLCHYVTAGDGSASTERVAARLSGEIRDRGAPDRSAGMSYSAIVELQAEYRRRRQHPLVVVIDGLDRLAEGGGASPLALLPEGAAPDVRTIVTMRPGPLLKTCVARGYEVLRIDSLSPDERSAMLNARLALHGKRLSPEHAHRLVRHRLTASPLNLFLILEELRLSATHATLGTRLYQLLRERNTAGLVKAILLRLEADFPENPGFVPRALGALWGARRGLSEAELWALGSGSRVEVSQLMLGLEPGLWTIDGRLVFSHDEIRDGVERAFVRDHGRQIHARLAEHFKTLELDRRVADELPWQLWRAGARRELEEALADLRLMRLLAEDEWSSDLRHYWRALRGHHFPELEYPKLIERQLREGGPSLESAQLCLSVGAFLFNLGFTTAAGAVLRHAVDSYRALKGVSSYEHGRALARFASQGLAEEESLPVLEQALRILDRCAPRSDPAHLAARQCYGQRLADAGRLEEAEACLRGVIDERTDDGLECRTMKMLAIGSLGTIRVQTGSFAEGERFAREELRMAEDLYGSEHISVAFPSYHLAAALYFQGRYREAWRLMRDALRVFSKELGRLHSMTVTTRAACYRAFGMMVVSFQFLGSKGREAGSAGRTRR